MTTDPTGWPDASKLGEPLNPERDGWHWLITPDEELASYEWRVGGEGERGPWATGWVTSYGEWGPFECAYLGPCLTPQEVAARVEAAAVAMREAAKNAAYLAAYEGKSPLAIADTITALPVATDALAAALAQARRDAMEEAAAMADGRATTNAARAYRGPDDYLVVVLRHLAAAIRAKAQEAPVVSNLDANHLAWTVERWRAEVLARPLRNIHRRALDDTWRQVMRRMGGDPDALVGPCHDELLAMDIKS